MLRYDAKCCFNNFKVSKQVSPQPCERMQISTRVVPRRVVNCYCYYYMHSSEISCKNQCWVEFVILQGTKIFLT